MRATQYACLTSTKHQASTVKRSGSEPDFIKRRVNQTLMRLKMRGSIRGSQQTPRRSLHVHHHFPVLQHGSSPACIIQLANLLKSTKRIPGHRSLVETNVSQLQELYLAMHPVAQDLGRNPGKELSSYQPSPQLLQHGTMEWAGATCATPACS